MHLCPRLPPEAQGLKLRLKLPRRQLELSLDAGKDDATGSVRFAGRHARFGIGYGHRLDLAAALDGNTEEPDHALL